MRIENLRDYRMDAALNAKLNLAELSKMFPMEGLEMKGTFNVAAKANGVYDSIKKIMPAVDISMGLADGYVKSSEFPAPLEDLKNVGYREEHNRQDGRNVDRRSQLLDDARRRKV